MHCIACMALAGRAGPSYDTFLFISTFTPDLHTIAYVLYPGLCAWLDAGRQEL